MWVPGAVVLVRGHCHEACPVIFELELYIYMSFLYPRVPTCLCLPACTYLLPPEVVELGLLWCRRRLGSHLGARFGARFGAR
jgi:hypothetical protein